MNKQGNIFGSVGKQFGGIAKAAAKRVVREPVEVIKTAVGVSSKGEESGQSERENQAVEAIEQAVSAQQGGKKGAQSSDQGVNSSQPNGFKTQEDFELYSERSENKDELLLRMARRELAREWGLESGMEKARKEHEQKVEEGEQVEEQEKQQAEAMKFEKEKKENEQITAAKNQSSAEKRGMMG